MRQAYGNNYERERNEGGGARGGYQNPHPSHPMPPFPGRFPGQQGHYNNNGARSSGSSAVVNFEERRVLRERSDLSIWPPSPKRPYAEDLAEQERDRSRSRKSKSSRRRKSRKYSSDSETDSEEEYERERRRRRRRERERERERQRDKDRGARSTSLADGEDLRGASRPRGARDSDGGGGGGWVEKENRAERRAEPAAAGGHSPAEADDGDEVGPQPPSELKIKDKFNREAYRGLLPGEGAGMQQFVERGERIPRRGEIGLDSDRIAQFEESGYVMSGNRHQRMNAVRLRKEGQVINAEEKRALLIMQREEKQRKEGAIVTQFKEMMDERLKLEERRQRERDEAKE